MAKSKRTGRELQLRLASLKPFSGEAVLAAVGNDRVSLNSAVPVHKEAGILVALVKGA
ncbi:hypothetical protein JG687_00003913 [Phytophthora cactorum]|uniref:Uncharacterized protein n=1 Tax=Phytophthora cactorum TaxID=29920 RepID=A0A8T1UUW9_9STRA|nr:hypothetical protein GQ600_2218 [Phytophthora cactorum]KAG6968161.1 hypothetical protein JG687_00003913 [Phytophthora cactorum]